MPNLALRCTRARKRLPKRLKLVRFGDANVPRFAKRGLAHQCKPRAPSLRPKCIGPAIRRANCQPLQRHSNRASPFKRSPA